MFGSFYIKFDCKIRKRKSNPRAHLRMVFDISDITDIFDNFDSSDIFVILTDRSHQILN